jgi:hypothetical protein
MKKIMFLIILGSVILMNSCKKPAVVVVQNNTTPVDYGYGLNSTLYDAKLMLYSGSDFVGEIALGDIPPGGGRSQYFELEDHVEKVKVRFRFFPSDQTQFDNPIKYTSQYFLINANEDNEIFLNDETLVSGSPDKKGEVKIGDGIKKLK